MINSVNIFILTLTLFNKKLISGLSYIKILSLEKVPSCWSQPFALRTGHELLRARYLTLNAMQQIAPLFDAQCPVLLTDISVLNTSRSSPDSDISALDVSRRAVSRSLRIRHLALFADRGLLRTLHFAPCVELASLHPQRLSPGT